ncbi:MAG: nuclear transport factor 2 family protein [Steroidobacteraceae bacterium]
MRKLVGAVLPACVCVALVFADPPKALSANSSIAETLTQLEHEYGDAIKAADTHRLDQILDDDWTELTSTAKILTKKELLGDLTSGKYKLESFEMGPMYVKVLGNVAVVQGSVSEKSISNGKESNHKAVWMDVMLKRGDRWVVVRSQAATAR